MSTKKKFYIKERGNPQLGTYYVKMGQMTKQDAKRYENGSGYGTNYMHAYDSETAYLEAIKEIEKASNELID